MKCGKATMNFRGRDWTILFNPEIPVSVGPWKLDGFPGLIVYASTEGKEGKYTLTLRQFRKSDTPILKPRKDSAEKLSRKKYYQFYDDFANVKFALPISDPSKLPPRPADKPHSWHFFQLEFE